MTDDDHADFTRRTVLQGTAGLGAIGLGAGSAAGRENGGGPPSSPPPGGADGGDDAAATVTLVTGHTIRVTERGDETHYSVVNRESGSVHVLDADEGTYVVPTDVNVRRFSRQLFNVDYLIDQGLTDEETDAIPVVLDVGGDSESGDVSATATGFSQSRELPSIGAVAGEIAKDQGEIATQDVTASSTVEHVYLDAEYETLLDTSADAVNAPTAREEFDVDGSGVSVAVLDTGIDADHPDFGDRVVHQEDFSGDGVADGNGHGTHCAGIAAGAGDADGEYVGMAPGADLMNVKVLDNSGSGRLSDIVAGIEHAVAEGADVISLSLGGSPQEDDPLVQAVDAAVEQGVVATVAAGNTSGYETVGTPGTAERAITVGASDEDGGIAGFSSAGPTPYDYRVKPEVVAPGVGITAAGSDDAGEYPYTDKSGTSMSTPHVAGVAALLLADDPDRSPTDVKSALVSTADRLDGPDVYQQGGGVIDAAAALGSDLRVDDAVLDFGLFTEETTETATVTVENTGSETVEVTPSATLTNVQSGDALSDNVSVGPSSLTVAPGETATVEVTVDTAEAFGYNSGVLELATGDGTTYRTTFGFVRGFEVTVDRNAHPDIDDSYYGILFAWDHEASFIHYGFSPFAFGDEYSFLLLGNDGEFKGGGDYSFWMTDQLEPKEGQRDGEPIFTGKVVEITPDNTHVTLDETEAIPRTLDTSRVSEHEPFEMQRFDAGLDVVFPDNPWFSYDLSKTGDYGVDTLHVTPFDEEQPATINTAYLMYPEETQGDPVLDNPTVYHLFYGATSVSGPENVVEVDPDELAEERFEYHRPAGESYSVYPHFYPADQQNHPKYISLAFETPIGDERVEQTWYRNDRTRYAEDWDVGSARFVRRDELVPDAGATYDQTFGRGPLAGRLSSWDLEDGTLTASGHYYADQADRPFVGSHLDPAGWNAYSVEVDGETADSGLTAALAFDPNSVDVEEGSVVDVSLHGNTLDEAGRGATTVTDFQVRNEAGTPNAPPEVTSVDVNGLDATNRVPAGQAVAFVEVDHEASSVEQLRAFYAPAGATSDTPFEDASGWQEAEVAYGSDGLYGVVLDVAGYTGDVDLAVSAVDAAGNRVEVTTFGALTVTAGARLGAPVAVQPDEIDLTSNGMVPVRVASGGDVDPGQIDADTVRLGPHDAVHGDGGATPVQSKRLGDGDLQLKFRASDLDFACDGPVAAYLSGALADGTTFSGADVVATILCDE